MTSTSAPRRLHLVTLVALAAIGLGACGMAEGVLSSSERREFTTASTAFIDANNAFQQAQVAPGQGESTDVALEQMRTAVAAMESAQAEMATVARSLDGKPREIADESVRAARAVIDASTAFVAALEASDPVAWTEAYDANSVAIASFNDATAAWNAL